MPTPSVTWIDLTILAGYVVATRVVFGWWAARWNRRAGGGAEGYFLGGRRMTWPLIGLSFYVANMSGGSFVGLAGAGYYDGIAVYHYEWLPALVLIFFTFFILPFFLKARVFTSPEFLEKRFGRGSRMAFSGFLLVAMLVVDAPASLYAGATITRALFPEIPVWWAIGAAAVIAGVYIAVGGLGAVVLNDALQATLILVGGVVITVLAWQEVGSWEAVKEAAAPRALHLIQPAGDDVLPWPGILTGAFWLSVYFWCTNQFVIQRALGARSVDDARWGSLLAGLLKLPNLFILILPGVLATVIYPDLDEPDAVFPLLAFHLLPVGLRGLMLAVLAAAILSSLEAILNSAATLVTMDFVRTARPDTPDRSLGRMGPWVTLAFMGLATLWTPVVTEFPTLFQYLQSVMSYITPPVVVVFLGGIFWRRATRQAALAVLAVGVPVGALAWVGVELMGGAHIQFLYAAGIALAFNALILVAVSLATPPPHDAQLEGLTWNPAFWREESRELAGKPWYRNHRVLAMGLATVSLAIVAWWW